MNAPVASGRSRPATPPSALRASASAGFTLVESMIAIALVGLGLLGTVMIVNVASIELNHAREVAVARLATTRVIEIMTSVSIRSKGATASADNSNWLFRGNYELARTVSGTSFLMPDLRLVATVAETTVVNGVSVETVDGWVRAEFPVPPLEPTGGFTHAGRVVMHVNESAQPATVPTGGFPFPASPGMTRLDCDGDLLATTADLRQGTDTAAKPARLVPAMVIIEWKSTSNRTERLRTPFLIGQPGF